MAPLSGRIALVTGASRGIGRAIALGLARAGADVAVNYRAAEAEARATAAAIEALGRRCRCERADVSRADEVVRLVDANERALGPIAILVNNAGITRPQPLEQITE